LAGIAARISIALLDLSILASSSALMDVSIFEWGLIITYSAQDRPLSFKPHECVRFSCANQIFKARRRDHASGPNLHILYLSAAVDE
jgi:hypothetical protein